jgi:methylated-DNA-[protein]-cysteine S-methyltransferase
VSGTHLASKHLAGPLGTLVAEARHEGIVRLAFERRRSGADGARSDHAPRAEADLASAHLETLARELGEYFSGARRVFSVPLVLQGTPFERRVWNRLLAIPYGSTCSYLEIARDLGVPNGARAVGRANGANPIAVVVPCHRVIETGGGLGGYGGGLDTKRFLLGLEGSRVAWQQPLPLRSVESRRA